MRKTASFKAGLLTVGAVALATVSTAAPLADPVSGPTRGAWNLPRVGDPGFAAGVLVDGETGRTVFRMRARLDEGPSISLLYQAGTITGRLVKPGPSLSAVGGFPIYSVNGRWVGSRITGTGRFEASISVQRSPLGPVILLGKIGGRYSDGPSLTPSVAPSITANSVGRYRGRWTANL